MRPMQWTFIHRPLPAAPSPCSLISGMHSSITAHICGDYLIDEATQTWGAFLDSCLMKIVPLMGWR